MEKNITFANKSARESLEYEEDFRSCNISDIFPGEIQHNSGKEDIPAIGEEVMSTEGEIVEDGLVHLNQATKEELMTLPGIGEAKAEAIVEYRGIHGGFSTKEELMNIPGIKEGVFLKIQDYITVE